MFVGETGIARILQRTCELLRAEPGLSGDVRRSGGIDLPMIQRHLNFWFSRSLDLHGSEVSTNAAAYFANGLKGRAKEDSHADHVAVEAVYPMTVFDQGRCEQRDVPMRNAMNEVLRDWYVTDCEAGVARWNALLERQGLSDRLSLPDRKFNRQIGTFANARFDPAGRQLSDADWTSRREEWLPSGADKAYLLSLMARPVVERGAFASYIAPPAKGINQRPVDFEYVRTDS